MKIHWTAPAEDDLRDIFEYIFAERPASASAVHALIRERVCQLEKFPHICRIGRADGTRELVVQHTPYIVVYRIAPAKIEILHVVHGARQWPPLSDDVVH